MKSVARLTAAVALCSCAASTAAFAQTAALQVVDSQGKVIGRYLSAVPGCGPHEPGDSNSGCDAAAIVVNGPFTALLTLNVVGFTSNRYYDFSVDIPQFLHLSTDCSGPRYLRLFGPADAAGLLPMPAFFTGGKMIIPIGPSVSMPFQSVEQFSSGPSSSDLTKPGICTATSETLGFFVTTVDPATIATPPFHVQ